MILDELPDLQGPYRPPSTGERLLIWLGFALVVCALMTAHLTGAE